MSCKSRIVKIQKIREVITKKKYSNETSPYWQHIENKRGSDHKQGDHQNESFESPLANPDILPELEAPATDLNREMIKKHWRDIKFSKQEKGVLDLLARGVTQENIAKALKTSRVAVAQAIIRIQKKGAAWYANKVANGGLIREEEDLE